MIRRIKQWLTARKDARQWNVEWEQECQLYWRKRLTGRHKHWCDEWDCLPLDDTCEEFHLHGHSPRKCGSCGYSKPEDNE